MALNVTNVVLDSSTKRLRISIRAHAATFTPPATTSITWNASDVRWVNGAWTNATGTDGTLSSAAYNVVAICNADVVSCDTSKLKFQLSPNPNIRRSGDYSLTTSWKVESISI